MAPCSIVLTREARTLVSCRSLIREISSSPRKIRPALGRWMPPNSVSRVDLPDPLGPRNATRSPGVDGEVDALQRHHVVTLEGLVEVHQALAAHGQAADRRRRRLGDLLHCDLLTTLDIQAETLPWLGPGSQTAGAGPGKQGGALVTRSIPV